MNNKEPRLLAYFGHHKCASTYSINICYEVCNSLGFRPIESKIAFEKSPEKIFPLQKSSFLISQTSIHNKVKELGDNFKGFHVIRDPRDICVSGYYSHLKTHFVEGWPKLGEYRKELQKLNKEEGLLKEFEYSDFWLQHIDTWDYNDPNIVEVKMEDLTENPLQEWIRVFDFLGLIDPSEKELEKSPSFSYKIKENLNRALKYRNLPEEFRFNKKGLLIATIRSWVEEKYSFKNLAGGRKQGQENTNSHYRKGKRGDWQNHFNDKHKAVFKEKYGDLLIKLGYEKDYNW